MQKLSELEGVVLGLVHTLQPCTAYRVRTSLTKSPSTYWSGSAGSVYPALTRLEDAGLVTSTADNKDGRGRRLLRITTSGRRLARKWTLEASSPGVTSGVFDPVRSRAFFLGVLCQEDRVQFATACLKSLETYLAGTRETLAEYEADTVGALGPLGAVFEAEARVAWMKTVLAELKRTRVSGKS